MKIKSGDTVKVIAGSGKIKGSVLKVASVDFEKNRVYLENGPTHKKHLKPERSKRHPEGGIIEESASIHISNVMLMSEQSSRPVRVGYEEKEGEKFRVARGQKTSGERI